MLTTLGQVKTEHPQISWRTPDGGMAIWLDAGENSSKLAARAIEERILVYPEQNYLLSGKTGRHLRLGFSGQTPAENAAGLKALSLVLKR